MRGQEGFSLLQLSQYRGDLPPTPNLLQLLLTLGWRLSPHPCTFLLPCPMGARSWEAERSKNALRTRKLFSLWKSLT